MVRIYNIPAIKRLLSNCRKYVEFCVEFGSFVVFLAAAFFDHLVVLLVWQQYRVYYYIVLCCETYQLKVPELPR